MKKEEKHTQAPRSHWKSLEELYGQPPAFETAGLQPTEASPSRRDFLKLMGFTLTTAALSACSRAPVYKAIPFLHKPEDLTPGLANWYATTCGACTAGCAALVKSRDGRPIKVEGNSLSPMTQGGLCAVGQASLLPLYDETRLQTPQWQGKPVSWLQLDEAVRQKLEALKTQGGKVVFLTGTILSPSTRRLIGEFLGAHPQSQHIQYDAVSAHAIRSANLQNFGEAVIPDYRFDRARRVVSFNADFLGTWISPVEFSWRYSQNRRPEDPQRFLRHVQFESDFSLTGANADERLLMRPSQERETVGALLKHVLNRALAHEGAGAGPVSLAGENFPFPEQQPFARLAQELWQHRGRSLVLSGSNDLAVQSAVNLINYKLGNIGTTIDLDNPSLQKQGDEGQMQQLIRDLEAGRIAALFVADCNPVYDHGLAADFKRAMQKVPFSLVFADRVDESAALATAVVPVLHYLEAWNDAQPKAHVFHLTQPLINPLGDRRSLQDSLLQWTGSKLDFYQYLQNYWTTELYPRQNRWLSGQSFWDQSLHDGVFIASEKISQPRVFIGDYESVAQNLRQNASSLQGFELLLYESVALRDGRHANNPWNQELPDPVTKLTWDNCVKMSPATAESLGVRSGDEISVRSRHANIVLPAYVQPGLPPKTVSIALGYGRTHAGKAGDGVGQNAYPWVRMEDGFFRYSNSVDLQKASGHRALATTQQHYRMEGREIIKEATLADYGANPRAGNETRPHAEDSLWKEWKTGPEKWGMVVDLNACNGCSACIVSCQVENNVPVVGRDEVARGREMHWIRVDLYYSGSEEAPEAAYQPMMCQHCANAPCETVCPVLATVHSSDGLNQQVYNRCVGTRYCANNCPYKVRRFNWFDYADNPRFDYHLRSPLGKMVLNPDIVVRSRGVMEKCSMCVQRIQETKLTARQEGRELRDGEIQTACQQSCPSKAIVFGNLHDPQSEVSRLAASGRYYGVLEELGVRPAVGYLTKLRNKG